MLQTLYNDFAIMTGGEIIRESFLDSPTLKDDIPTVYIGEAGHATIGQKSTFIKDFYNRNEEMYKKIMMDATAQYKLTEEDYMNRGLVDTKLHDMKQRISKLSGCTGIIRVGGYSTLEKRANFDLVEDAVKACESAFIYGYNTGGSMIIPWHIRNNGDEKSQIDYAIDSVVYDAFVDVFKTIYKNKYNDIKDTEIDNIVDELVSAYEPVAFDLITENYTKDVINSCITDIEILKASMSIIALLISSNQYISINVNEN